MTDLKSETLTVRSTFQSIQFRAEIRLLLLASGLATALIWTVAAIAVAWMRFFGYGAFVPWIAVAWFVVALPVMYLDLALILDMVGYTVTGKIYFFPALLAYRSATTLEERNTWSSVLTPPGVPTRRLSEADAQRLSRLERSRVASALLTVIDATSPFGTLALWSMIVLARIPASAHVLREPSRARAMKLRADKNIYGRAFTRFAA